MEGPSVDVDRCLTKARSRTRKMKPPSALAVSLDSAVTATSNLTATSAPQEPSRRCLDA